MARRVKKISRVGQLPVIYLPASLSHLVGQPYELDVQENQIVIRLTGIRNAEEDLQTRIMARLTTIEQNLRKLKKELEVVLHARGDNS